jgi:replicative DNA helicase
MVQESAKESQAEAARGRKPQALQAEMLAGPCDLDAERAVLASVLLEPDTLSEAMSVLTVVSDSSASGQASSKGAVGEDHFRRLSLTIFRDPRHAALYEAMLNLNNKGIGIDILTVSDWLKRNGRLEGVGGQAAILEIQSSIASTANMEGWCQILRDFAMLREMLKVCTSSMELCRTAPKDEVKALLDKVESGIYNVRNKFVQPEIKVLKEVVVETFEYFMKVLDKKIEPGIPTGFPELDDLTAGLKPGEMFVLAARPSIGKTALALNIVRNIALKCPPDGKRKKVAFFSLEMSAEQIGQRLLCTEAGVSLQSIIERSFKKTDITKLTKAVTLLKGAEIYIDPTGGISVYELRAKARKLKDQHDIDIIVVDYLQLMRAGDNDKESRQVEVSAISGGLKKLAKDLNVPVLVLAQLNREVDKGQGPKSSIPKLSHLRESGAIEQDADVVVFLHRNRDDAKEGGNPAALKEGVESMLIVEKNRNGRTGKVDIRFFPNLMEFRSITHRFGEDDKPSAT